MYKFDLGWFLWGVAILIAGILIIRFHMKIADSLASGVSSYNKTKLFGIIACGIGFLLMTNLHTNIILFIMHLIMPNKF